MLILLARSSSNLSIDEEKVLADRFQLPSALPSIIQSPYVERLFEIFELAAAKRSMNAICDALLPVLMRVRFVLLVESPTTYTTRHKHHFLNACSISLSR